MREGAIICLTYSSLGVACGLCLRQIPWPEPVLLSYGNPAESHPPTKFMSLLQICFSHFDLPFFFQRCNSSHCIFHIDLFYQYKEWKLCTTLNTEGWSENSKLWVKFSFKLFLNVESYSSVAWVCNKYSKH